MCAQKSLGMNIWKEVQIILDNWQEMAHDYETTWWAYTWFYKMLCMWGIFVLPHRGVWEHVTKVCKDRPYATTNDHKNNDHKSMVARWEALHVPPTTITHHVHASNAWTNGFLIYTFSMHQNFSVQSIIQVMEKFV